MTKLTLIKSKSGMDLKLIKTDSDYQAALDKLDKLFNAKIGSPESDEADVLAVLIDDYEKKYFKIDAPDPIEAIKIRMEEMDLKQKDLVGVIGGKSSVSEVLNRKKKLTIEMVRKLSSHLNVSPQILINDYSLTK